MSRPPCTLFASTEALSREQLATLQAEDILASRSHDLDFALGTESMRMRPSTKSTRGDGEEEGS